MLRAAREAAATQSHKKVAIDNLRIDDGGSTLAAMASRAVAAKAHCPGEIIIRTSTARAAARVPAAPGPRLGGLALSKARI